MFLPCLNYCNGIKSKSLAGREEWGESIEDLRRKEVLLNSLHTCVTGNDIIPLLFVFLKERTQPRDRVCAA